MPSQWQNWDIVVTVGGVDVSADLVGAVEFPGDVAAGWA